MDRRRLHELLEHFRLNGIVKDDARNKNYLDFQDEIGHSTRTELKEFEKGLESDERRTFIWAVFSCLDIDTAVSIVKETYLQRLFEIMQEACFQHVETEMKAIDKKINTFNDCKKAYWKRLRKEREEKERYRKSAEHWKNEAEELNRKYWKVFYQLIECKEKAAKMAWVYDNIKFLLSD